MKKHLIISTFALASTLFSFNLKQETRKIMADKATSSATYAMKHPMHSWDGTSKKVSGVIVYSDKTKSIQQTAISIPVASFDSDNSNRDSHAIEVLEGLKFPNVTFKSSDVKINQGKFVANGSLTFHGVSKNIKVEGKVKESAKSIVLDGTFNVLMSEYQIENPTLMGIKTEDLIKINFSVGFNL